MSPTKEAKKNLAQGPGEKLIPTLCEVCRIRFLLNTFGNFCNINCLGVLRIPQLYQFLLDPAQFITNKKRGNAQNNRAGRNPKICHFAFGLPLTTLPITFLTRAGRSNTQPATNAMPAQIISTLSIISFRNNLSQFRAN